jgi:hypothetical protein
MDAANSFPRRTSYIYIYAYIHIYIYLCINTYVHMYIFTCSKYYIFAYNRIYLLIFIYISKSMLIQYCRIWWVWMLRVPSHDTHLQRERARLQSHIHSTRYICIYMICLTYMYLYDMCIHIFFDVFYRYIFIYTYVFIFSMDEYDYNLTFDKVD